MRAQVSTCYVWPSLRRPGETSPALLLHPLTEPHHSFIPQNWQNPWPGLDAALEASGLSQRSAQHIGPSFLSYPFCPGRVHVPLPCSATAHAHKPASSPGILQSLSTASGRCPLQFAFGFAWQFPIYLFITVVIHFIYFFAYYRNLHLFIYLFLQPSIRLFFFLIPTY